MTQPEALRLADALEYDFNTSYISETMWKAAAELRRLHQSEREGWRYADELEQERQRLNEVNQELLEALTWISTVNAMDYEYQQKAKQAIQKAQGNV